MSQYVRGSGDPFARGQAAGPGRGRGQRRGGDKPKEAWRTQSDGVHVYYDAKGKKLTGSKAYKQAEKEAAKHGPSTW